MEEKDGESAGQQVNLCRCGFGKQWPSGTCGGGTGPFDRLQMKKGRRRSFNFAQEAVQAGGLRREERRVKDSHVSKARHEAPGHYGKTKGKTPGIVQVGIAHLIYFPTYANLPPCRLQQSSKIPISSWSPSSRSPMRRSASHWERLCATQRPTTSTAILSANSFSTRSGPFPSLRCGSTRTRRLWPA